MKYILILFVIFSTAFDVFALPQGGGDDMNQQIMKIMQNCFMQNGIDPSKATDEKLQSDDPEVKCFHACMAKETKLMNRDGTINKAALLTFSPNMPEDYKQHLTNIRTPCLELKGHNECETGYLLFKCLAPE